MIGSINKLVLITLVFILAGACKNENKDNLFSINGKSVKAVEMNEKCTYIFDKAYGVDSLNLKKHHYIEALLNRYLQLNKRQKYKTFTFLRIDESGEVSTSKVYTVGELENGTGIVSRYFYEDDKIKKVDKTFKNINNFYQKLGEPEEKIRSFDKKLLVIKFKSNDDCECKLYSSSLYSYINNIKDLTFFD